jgi:hypothetical protein
MGSVYRAYQAALDRTVALKTVQPHFLTPEGLELFRQEARALARARHPSIVQLLEFHPEHAVPYFLMEYVDGVPLDRALRGRPWRDVAVTFSEVAAAVAWAHDHGVVHGDLKPANILVDREGKPHILDFGLARVMFQAGAPRGGGQGGTPGYLAPEVLAGQATVGVLSDVFALGVTLYVALTGVAPFQSLPQALAGDVRLPLEHNPDIPEPLQRISLKAIEKQPGDRYQTAEQMLRDLERYVEGKPLLTRPSHYNRELQGRVDNHLSDLRMWEKEGLVSRREMDALARPYERVLAGDSPWLSETRAVLTGALLIRVGAWLLLLSAVLWPAFYWHHLGRAARLASSGGPTIFMAALGAVFVRLGNRRSALACLGSFALLLLVLVVVVLSEFRWLEFPQSPEWELWGERLHERIPAADGPEPADFLDQFILSNTQVLAAALTVTLCIAALLRGLRAVFFASWLALAFVGLFCSVLLLAGDKERLLNDRVAWVALHFVGLGPVLYVFGAWVERRWFERREAAQAARPFYWLALAVSLVAGVALARFGTEEWFGQDWQEDNEVWSLWLLCYAGPLLLGAWLSERYGSEGQRVLGGVLYLLVPLFLLVPLNLLFHQGPALATVGRKEVQLYELFQLPACVALLVLGRVLHIGTLLMAALAGLAVFLVRVSYFHFEDYLHWPLAVAAGGVLLVALGVWRSWANERSRRPRPTPQSRSAEAPTTPLAPSS